MGQLNNDFLNPGKRKNKSNDILELGKVNLLSFFLRISFLLSPITVLANLEKSQVCFTRKQEQPIHSLILHDIKLDLN